MMYTVYKITNALNLKYYIGVHKTEKPNDDYFGSGLIIRRMIHKYNKNNFKKEILYSTDTKEDAFEKEKELIDLKDCNCINISEGGQGGALFTNKKHSIKTKKQIRDKMTGRVLTKESRLKISKANARRKITEKTRNKLSDIKRKWFSINNGENRNKMCVIMSAAITDVVRNKMSLARLKRKQKLGYLLDEHSRKKISDKLTGRKLTEVHKNNIKYARLKTQTI